MPLLSKLLFQLFITRKVRNRAVRKMLKSRKVHNWKVCSHQWPRCRCKKIWIKEPTSQRKYLKRVLRHVQNRARESQKRKHSIVRNLSALPKGHPCLLGSLDQMIQKFLMALRIRGGSITSVMAVSVANALRGKNAHLVLIILTCTCQLKQKAFFAERVSKNIKTTGQTEIADEAK